MVGRERSAGKTRFEEKLIFEIGEVGKGINIISVETVEIGTTVGGDIRIKGGGRRNGMTEGGNRFLSKSELLGSLGAEEVVIPLTTSDLIDGFIVEARVIFEGCFVGRGEVGIKVIGVGYTKLLKLGFGMKSIGFVAESGVKKRFDVIHATFAFNRAEVEVASLVGAAGREFGDFVGTVGEGDGVAKVIPGGGSGFGRGDRFDFVFTE